MKVLKCLMASVCAFALVACVAGGATGGGAAAKEDNAIHIDKETAKSYIQATELTTDNWDSLFELTSRKELDSFGDETGEESYILVAKSPNVAELKDGAIKYKYHVTETSTCKDPDTGEALEESSVYENDEEGDSGIWYDGETGQVLYISMKTYISEGTNWINNEERKVIYDHEYEISDFEVENIVGTLYEVVIPDDVWNTSEDGTRYISFDMGGGYNTYMNIYENCRYEYVNTKTGDSTGKYDFEGCTVTYFIYDFIRNLDKQ